MKRKQKVKWHLGSMMRLAMDTVPGDRPAVIDAHCERTLSWSDLRRRSHNICIHLQASGIKRGDKVAIYSRNGIEYVEAILAILQIGAVHVNVNFRYTAEELLHIFFNSDAKAVFCHAEFTQRLAEIAPSLPELDVFIGFGEAKPVAQFDSLERDLDHVLQLQHIADSPHQEMPLSSLYSQHPEDQFFMYTGGTTGLPKGAMWSQNNLFKMICINYFAHGGPRQPESPEDLRGMLLQNTESYCEMVIAPMMHGLGIYSVLPTLAFGGTVVTSSAANFDASAVWQAISDYTVNAVKIPGDAMGNPLLKALEFQLKENPSAWQLKDFVLMISSAAVFSGHIKRGLVDLLPQLTINDILGGSESAALGHQLTTAKSHGTQQNVNKDERTLKLKVNEFVTVFTEDHQQVRPGSGEIGMVARCGLISDGYYKDPERSAKAFPVINGKRYCLLGDWAEVLADGTLKFLGRGNVCINTGGEKVFPEEVEQALKCLPAIEDCCVVGIADDRWGSAVSALVQRSNLAEKLDLGAVDAALRAQLAGYKVPKVFIMVDDIGRAPNGKLDYTRMQKMAADTVAKFSAEERPNLMDA
jgi:acyl-CoA synthetase (AMP-forming)/AMP-acid ligase II